MTWWIKSVCSMIDNVFCLVKSSGVKGSIVLSLVRTNVFSLLSPSLLLSASSQVCALGASDRNVK